MSVWRLPVDLSWTGATGSPGVNVFDFRVYDAGGVDTGLNAAIDSLEDFYTAIQGNLPSSLTVSFAGEAVRQTTGDDNPEATAGLHRFTVQGTSGNSYLPPANCIILTLKTAHYGRSGRGRKFLGPLVAAVAQDNGTVKEAIRLQVAQAAVDHLITPFAGIEDGAFAVYSRKDHASYDVTGVNVPNEFGVLRSRRD